jgi:tripartite-type tricarboxylate transporter receptor subunit TctC
LAVQGEDTMKSATNLADYPTKPVSIIEPFGAGGGPDLLARALAPKLSELWGQPVMVENIPGAGATAGPAQVAKSPADGHTLLMNTSAQAYSAALVKDLPYDPLKSFIPILPLTKQAYVLVAGKATSVSTVGELITSAQTKADELKFGSTGTGTGTHVGVEKFNRATGLKALHVAPSPKDSNADTIANAIASRFTYCLVPISLALPHIRNGTLVALGVSTAQRSILLPDVPTIAEAGVASFDFPIWYGIWVPAGTSAGVVDKLANDIGRVLAGRDLREWVADHGGEPMRMTQPEFARFVENESEAARRIIAAASVEL